METLCQVSERWITFCSVELRMSLCWWVIMGRWCTDWRTLGTVQINACAPKRVRKDRLCLFEGWASICMLCTAILISNIENALNELKYAQRPRFIIYLCTFILLFYILYKPLALLYKWSFLLSIVMTWSIKVLILSLTIIKWYHFLENMMGTDDQCNIVHRLLYLSYEAMHVCDGFSVCAIMTWWLTLNVI